jgi:DNA-binding transcriptional ArsR family regulator
MHKASTTDLAFSALAHPVRREILCRLRSREHTVMELTKPFGLSQPTITRHLDVLEEAGLIRRRKDAQRRLCAINYPALSPLIGWLEELASDWSTRLDRLANYAEDQTRSQEKS